MEKAALHNMIQSRGGYNRIRYLKVRGIGQWRDGNTPSVTRQPSDEEVVPLPSAPLPRVYIPRQSA